MKRIITNLRIVIVLSIFGCSMVDGNKEADMSKTMDFNQCFFKESQDLSGFQTTSSGLKYRDIVVGTGPAPKTGDKILVHYTGWLTNCSKFDSSVDRNDPLPFNIGVGQVIKGWDEGVGSMKVGGKRLLVIPANLAYGNRGIGSIPANSTLLFAVELINVVK